MSFLALPAEIRLSIYRYVFEDSKIVLMIEEHSTAPQTKSFHAYGTRPRPRYKVSIESAFLRNAITKTCHQIRTESVQNPLHPIHLQCHIRTSVRQLDLLKQTPITQFCLNSIVSIRLVFSTLDIEWPFKAFPALRKATMSYQEDYVGADEIHVSDREIQKWVESSDLAGLLRRMKNEMSAGRLPKQLNNREAEKDPSFTLLWHDAIVLKPSDATMVAMSRHLSKRNWIDKFELTFNWATLEVVDGWEDALETMSEYLDRKR